MDNQVEILKIGTIMPVVPIKGTSVYDTSQFRKKTIMIVCDGGPVFDYYVSKFRENCSHDFNFLNTAQSIVGKPQSFRRSFDSQPDTLKGISDGDPIIGKPYTINNSSWYTSKVEKIIDDYLIITKNSVYALHRTEKVRDKKLKDLGI